MLLSARNNFGSTLTSKARFLHGLKFKLLISLMFYQINFAYANPPDFNEAIQLGDIEKLKTAIFQSKEGSKKWKINFNELDEKGDTPLHHAVFANNIEMTKLLVENGSDIQKPGEQQLTPLHLAAMVGNKEMVAFLIKMGANVNSQDAQKLTPFLHALIHENDDVINTLLKTNQTTVQHEFELAKNIGEAELLQLFHREVHEAQEIPGTQENLKKWHAEAQKRSEERNIRQVMSLMNSANRLSQGSAWGENESVMRKDSPEFVISTNNLDLKYPQAIPNSKFALNALIDKLRHNFKPKDELQGLKTEAALRFLNRVKNGNLKGQSKHRAAKLTVEQYIALNWYAINDKSLYPGENDREDRLWAFIESMANIQRAHNDNDCSTPIDWKSGKDKVSCIPGTFIRLLEHLDDIHPAVRLVKQISNDLIIRAINDALQTDKGKRALKKYLGKLNNEELRSLKDFVSDGGTTSLNSSNIVKFRLNNFINGLSERVINENPAISRDLLDTQINNILPFVIFNALEN